MNRAARRRHRALWMILAALLIAAWAVAWHTRAVRQRAASRPTEAPSVLEGPRA
jgi:hypothetical protein